MSSTRYSSSPHFPGQPLQTAGGASQLQTITYGRRRLAFARGSVVHTSTVLTIRAEADEDEAAFTQRLLEECIGSEGTIEIVFRAGAPEYAVITISMHKENGQFGD